MNTSRLVLLTMAAACAASLVLAADAGKDILRRSLDLGAAIQDYSAELVVTMDLPGVQVPRRTAQVYYKRPNKVAIKSRGVVMIPKRALMPGNLGTELTKDTQVSIVGKKVVNGITTYTLKVIPSPAAAPPAPPSGGKHGRFRPAPPPRSGNERLLVSVRGDRYTVERMEVYTGTQKDLEVAWTYQYVGGRYWMPQLIAAHIYDWRAPKSEKRDGTVTVSFSKLRVNTGLSDKLFEETKRK
jgi:hypothetical protein